MTVTKIKSAVKSTSIGTSNIPGAGEQASSTIESGIGIEADGASVNSKTFGTDSHLGKMVFIEDDTGATIEIENAKASIRVSKSGHLDIVSSSGSGITVTATSGKVVLNAVDVMIKSSGSMSIDAGADLNLNAKGSINMTTPTGAITMTGQSLDQRINGTVNMTITKELNQIIGGHMRSTVAGDHRTQITGFSYNDIGGEYKIRATGEMMLNTSDSMNMFAGADSTINSKGTMTLSSQSTTNISGDGITVASSGVLALSGDGTEIYGSTVNIDGSTIDMQNGGATAKTAIPAQAPEKAHTVEAITVQDEISTVRKSPGYAYNGKNRTNSGTGRMRNKGASGSGRHGENPNAIINGVDERLVKITDCAKQKFEAQTGYRVGTVSGLRPGDKRFHGQGKAMDFAIYDQSGNMFGNYQNGVTSEGFRAYEAFAQQAKACQEQLYPGLPIRWGGYFWNGGKGNYGAMDPMHLDIGGVSTGGGSWSTGASQQQLSEWGLDSSASKAYTGIPNYEGISVAKGTNDPVIKGNEGVESGVGAGDQYKKFVNTDADKDTKKNISSDPKKITQE